MHASKSRTRSRPAGGGPERLLLGGAMLIPLGVVLLVLSQLPATGVASAFSLTLGDPAVSLVSKRPVASNPAPPPTLAPATSTPVPAATPGVPTPAAVSHAGGMYVVQPGDELKSIAASYQVSIFKIIAANNIPDPDSLQIGQELHIPPG